MGSVTETWNAITVFFLGTLEYKRLRLSNISMTR